MVLTNCLQERRWLVMNLHVRMASPVWFEKLRPGYVCGPSDAALACEGAQTCVAAGEGGATLSSSPSSRSRGNLWGWGRRVGMGGGGDGWKARQRR
jgi:hypothetical protein